MILSFGMIGLLRTGATLARGDVCAISGVLKRLCVGAMGVKIYTVAVLLGVGTLFYNQREVQNEKSSC